MTETTKELIDWEPLVRAAIVEDIGGESAENGDSKACKYDVIWLTYEDSFVNKSVIGFNNDDTLDKAEAALFKSWAIKVEKLWASFVKEVNWLMISVDTEINST